MKTSTPPVKSFDHYHQDNIIDNCKRYEDLLKVISISKKTAKDYLIALKDTLARPIELDSLTWDRVDFKNSTLTLDSVRTSKKFSVPRTIAMTSDVRKVLKRKYRGNLNNIECVEWVFFKNHHRVRGDMVPVPYRLHKKTISKLCKDAGVDYFDVSSIRYYSAVHLYYENVPLGKIQEQLGHFFLETTKKFLYGQRSR